MSPAVCAHAKTKRGKDIPRRWGSFRSEVCKQCGKFRALDHHGVIRGDWQPASEYADAVSEQELD